MRIISKEQSEKLYSTTNVRHANTDLSLDMWISRPTVPLTDSNFIEWQRDVISGQISDVSIAVAHPKVEASNSQVFIGYIENGVAKVVSALCKTHIKKHIWIDSGFSEPAESISIAFDGTMPKAESGRIEFITDESPWVFWTNNGILYARKLGESETIVLAESNCEDVSAIRAMWSEVGSFDFGLCTFFILAGSIYYRQLIDGEWTDGTPITFGPSGVIWTEIVAQRTWDYRVSLQAKTSSGSTYELFTQYMGVGKQNTEHLEIKSITATGGVTETGDTTVANEEHIEIAAIKAGALYGGVYGFEQPIMLHASNLATIVEVDGEQVENYGLRISVCFAEHLNPDSVSENLSSIVMRDRNGTAFVAASADTVNGLDWVFTLPDFNNAIGDCIVSYTPGTLYTMAGTVAEGTSITFTPENLIPNAVEAPKIMEVYND